MSAELLREAAAKLRRLAENASPGPWSAEDRPTFGAGGVPVSCVWDADDALVVESHIPNDPDVDLIASMHPGVALSAADWLDATAARADEIADATPGSPVRVLGIIAANVVGFNEAVAVARAVLGREE